MSDVISVHLRWRLLKASHRVYNAADMFPSAHDVRSGRYGSQSEHDKTQLGAVIEHLQNHHELNIPGRESLDIGKLSSDVADWELETLANDITLEDIDVIQHPHVFSSACTSLFTKMAYNPTCEAPHTAKLHISGFKQDRLVMNIKTCQETDSISAAFTRSFGRPSSFKVFHSRHLCSAALSGGATPEVLHVAFDSEMIWIDGDGGGGEFPSLVGHDKSLDKHLAKERRLKAKYRKLASVLLTIPVLQLSNSPWIEQHHFVRPGKDSKQCFEVKISPKSNADNVAEDSPVEASTRVVVHGERPLACIGLCGEFRHDECALGSKAWSRA